MSIAVMPIWTIRALQPAPAKFGGVLSRIVNTPLVADGSPAIALAERLATVTAT
jgi:hypothetical protein